MLLMPGSRFFLKCQSYHSHLPFPLLLPGISWAKCEDFKVWLHLILLYILNHLSPLENKIFLKSRKEKRNSFHWAPGVPQDNIVTFNPCSNPDAGGNNLHFIGWETEGPKESMSFLHHKISELNPCLILMSTLSPLYRISHLLPSRSLYCPLPLSKCKPISIYFTQSNSYFD